MRSVVRFPRLMAIASLLVFGAIRWPVERSIANDHRVHRFREGVMLEQSLRERLGQLGFAASLGGFRSFLATIFELRAITAWQEVDYDQVESDYNLVTQLQPQAASYWETAAWQVGKNAVSYYLNFDLDRPLEERELDAAAKRERARLFYEDGIAYNPDDYRLLMRYGSFLTENDRNYLMAAEMFRRSYQASGGRYRQAIRFAGYSLAKVPGKEREAYEILMGVYRVGDVRPNVIMVIKELEEKLGIEPPNRIPDPVPEVFRNRPRRN